MKEWQRQRIAEARAEVAESALLLVLQYIDAMKAGMSPVYFGPSGLSAVEKFDRKWEPVYALDAKFSDASNRLQITFDDKSMWVFLDELWKVRARVWSLQSAHQHDPTMYEQAYDKSVYEELDAIRKRALEQLKPYATMQVLPELPNPEGSVTRAPALPPPTK